MEKKNTFVEFFNPKSAANLPSKTIAFPARKTQSCLAFGKLTDSDAF